MSFVERTGSCKYKDLRKSTIKLVGTSLLATLGIFLTKTAIEPNSTTQVICASDINPYSCEMVVRPMNEYLTAIEHPIFTASSLVLAGVGTIAANIQLGRTINLLAEKKPLKTGVTIKNLYPQITPEKSKIA